MATTINTVFQKQGDAGKVLHLDLSAGAADTSVTYTIGVVATNVAVPISGLVACNVTTGAINPASMTYGATTGLVTVPCANSDRVRIAVFLAT